MKHSIKITILLLAMFLVTQFIGLAVLNADPLNVQAEINGTVQDVPNPYLTPLQPPQPETGREYADIFSQVIIAFVIAVVLLFLLMKFKIQNIMSMIHIFLTSTQK